MALLFRIFLAVMIAVSPVSCVAASLGGRSTETVTPGESFSGKIKSVPGGGHFILRRGAREYDVVLSDFDAPRVGEQGDDKFVKAMNFLRQSPIACDVDRVEPDAIYARCWIESYILLSGALRKLNVPERAKDSGAKEGNSGDTR